MRFSNLLVALFLVYGCLSTPVYAQFDYTSAILMPLNGSASGSMDESSSNYWWKVITTADGSLYINTLATSNLEIDNYIYDQNGNTQIANYDFNGSHPEDQVHFNNLAAGTYYIKSYRYSGAGTYTITSTFTASRLQNDSEPNDSALVALNLSLNETKRGHLGFFGNGKIDTNDWWKITTTVNGSLYINTLSDSTLEIDNYIYDQSGNTQIARYDFNGSHPEDQVHFNDLAAGTYYIKSYRYSGYGSYTITSAFTASTVQVEDNGPHEFRVSKAWPNPFNPTTTIRYDLPETQHVRLTVFDVLGRQVVILEDGIKSAGVHDVVWNAGNSSGGSLSSGYYIWLLEAGPYRAQGGMMLLR